MKGFEKYLRDHIAWSKKVFGDGERTEGLCKHIESELSEVRAVNGKDLYEWIDIIILALDGAWRAGFSPFEIAMALRRKQDSNKTRSWKKVAPDDPSFHLIGN